MEPRPERQPLLGPSSDEEAPPQWWRAGAGGGRGRAASKVRGAAALMHQWPDHIISAVYNYWMMLLFMTILLLVTYGLIMTFSVMPSNRFRHGRGLKHSKDSKIIDHKLRNLNTSMQQVYCPIIMNSNQRLNMTKYTQFIKSLKKDFPNFQYNLIILSNDTEIKSAINNNEVAMKAVLNNNEIAKEEKYVTITEKDCNTEKHLLSNFLDNSPLKETWRTLSVMLIPFLVRTVAIWEGGGVVFDLEALLEHSHQAEKLNEEVIKVLEDFTIYYNTSNMHVTLEKTKKTINNIRDVIDDLENNYLSSIPQNNLSSEESEISQTPIYLRSLLSVPVVNESTHNKPNQIISPSIGQKDEDGVINLLRNGIENRNILYSKSHSINKSEQQNRDYISHQSRIKTDLLPYFLKMQFNNNSSIKGIVNINNLNSTTNENGGDDMLIENIHHSNKLSQKRESISPDDNMFQYKKDLNVDIITMTKDNIGDHDTKPRSNPQFSRLLESENDKFASINDVSIAMPKEQLIKRLDDKISNMVLDIEGKLIATMTSCHAFLGYIFAIVRKYPNLKSPKEVIDQALKLFCHGKLDSYCYGVRICL